MYHNLYTILWEIKKIVLMKKIKILKFTFDSNKLMQS